MEKSKNGKNFLFPLAKIDKIVYNRYIIFISP